MPEYALLLRSAFLDLWESTLLVLPQVILALLILTLGLILASALSSAVERLTSLLKVDDVLRSLDVHAAFERANLTLHIGKVLGFIVRWFIIILTLITVADILKWTQITSFLSDVVSYIPNVIIAVVILIVGLMLGGFVQRLIQGTMDATKLTTGTFIAGIAKWAIVVFSFMAALVQLGIAEALIQVLFTGFVAMLAIAGGLAFGLGGKRHAEDVLEYLRRDLSEKKRQAAKNHGSGVDIAE